MTSYIRNVRENAYAAKAKGVDVLDSQLPPSRREELIQNVKGWSSENPKLAGFLFAQLVISGIPILTFGLFALVVLLSSLATCLIIGLIFALTFTALCIGGALLILLPTLLVTSIAATFVFVWGVLGYYITRRFNNGEMPVNSVQEARERLREAANQSVARVQTTYKHNIEPMLPARQSNRDTHQSESNYSDIHSNGISRHTEEEETSRDDKLLEDLKAPLKYEKDPTGKIQIAPQQ